MTPKKAYYFMATLLIVSAFSVLAVTYFGTLELKNYSSKLVDLKSENSALNNQQLELAKANQNIRKYENLEELTQTIVPQDKDQARAVREIVTLAEESGFQLKNVTFPTSNLGAKIPAQPKTDTSNDTTPTPQPNPVSQAKPVTGVKGLYSLEATISPSNDIDYHQLIDFLSKLEKNRRTALVTKIKIDPKSSSRANPKIDFLLTINIFLKP